MAVILTFCLWSVFAIDYATPGLFDRAGNIKFQDFLQFPISARLIERGHANELYDDQVLAREIRAIVGRDTSVYLQYFYGPQVALPFIPFASLPFLTQAALWMALSLAVYLVCIFLIWKRCPALRAHGLLVALSAIAYPPVFHFVARGQLSVPVLVCVTSALLAFWSGREFVAGVTLGFLAFKPQFIAAIPLMLLFARAWTTLAGLEISAIAQLTLTYLYFGRTVMHAYFARLLHSAGNPASTELMFSAIQMHSLHSFWELLIPWPHGVWMLYLLSSFAVIGIAAAVWNSSAPMTLRFSAMLICAILVNPHLYIYDLIALAPAIILLVEWSLENPQSPSKPALDTLLYLAFLLPLFGPVAYFTRIQVSVPVFVALLWTLRRMPSQEVPVGT